MMPIYDVGIHLNIPESVYHSDPCSIPSLSASVAKTLLGRSPLHAWLAHPKLGGGDHKRSPSMSRGTIIHDLLLNGGAEYEVVVANDFKTKKAQEQRDEILARGAIPIIEHKFQECVDCVQAISSQIGDVLEDCQKETSLIWHSPEKVLCRGRLDLFSASDGQARIRDLKTCENAAASATANNILKYGYDISCAAYEEAVGVLSPEYLGRVSTTFMFIEVKAPYAIKSVVLSGAFKHLGRSKWDRAKARWQKCLVDGRWPAYPSLSDVVEPPSWALNADLDEQLAALDDESTTEE